MSVLSKIVVAAMVAGAGLALAAPAAATGSQKPSHDVCATWKARGATGKYPDVTFGGKPAGTTVLKYSAVLTKPAEGVDPGVEFATKNLDVTADGTTTVSVKYALGGGASHAAGAIRLFGYTIQDADTLNDGPQYTAIAAANAGTLSFTLPDGAKLGTLGLVYDASNPAKGFVKFTYLKIGEKKVSFWRCPKPTPTATATATPTATATATPTATATSPSASPTVTTSPSSDPTDPVDPPPGAAGGGPQLPVTGPGVGVLVGLGVVIVAAGVGLAVIARRRGKTQFTA